MAKVKIKSKTKLRKNPTKTAATRKGATAGKTKKTAKFEDAPVAPKGKKKKKAVKRKPKAEAEI